MALYNDARPQTFDEVIGQEHVVAPLKAQIKEGRFPSVLFIGLPGTGKTTMARLLALAGTCIHPDKDGLPCGKCEYCRAVMKTGHSLNVYELDAARNRGIAEMNELIKSTKTVPGGSGRKFYIIDEVHELSYEAFNALLKTLEEPPSYCTFILCTTEKKKVPATIMSRCQVYEFRPIDNDDIVSQMKKVCARMEMPYEEEGLVTISRHAKNSLRTALSALEQCSCGGELITKRRVSEILGYPDEERLFALLKATVEGDYTEIYDISRFFESKGISASNVLGQMVEALFDIQRLIVTGEAAGGTYAERCAEMIERFNSDVGLVCSWMKKVSTLRTEISSNEGAAILMASGLVKIHSDVKNECALMDYVDALKSAMSEMYDEIETLKKKVAYFEKNEVTETVSESESEVPDGFELVEETPFDNEEVSEEEVAEEEVAEEEVNEEEVADEVKTDEKETSEEDGEEGAISFSALAGRYGFDDLGEDDVSFPSESGAGADSAELSTDDEVQTESVGESVKPKRRDLDSLWKLF